MPVKTVDAYMGALPAQQREIAETLRKLVLEAAPHAKESIKWAQPVYEENGPFAYIKSHRAHVTLGFWRGLDLDGGRAILESSGSKMAHLKIASLGEIDKPLLSGFVKQAVKLNHSRGDPTKDALNHT